MDEARAVGAQPKVVLVTGASSGIGRAIATHLSHRGYRVIGTSRRPRLLQSLPFELLELDVQSEDSAASCVETVLRRNGRLDVLINNAGSGLFGAIEETAIDQVRSLFETNFFGVVRLTRAVLPELRKQGGGNLINIGSAGGINAMPFSAFYSATKFALEGYTEALRYEVKQFHIHVSLVEPPFVRDTNFGPAIARARVQLSEYAAPRARVAAMRREHAERGVEAAQVAATVASILEDPAPRLRYLMVDRDSPRFNALRKSEDFEPLMRRFWRLDP